LYSIYHGPLTGPLADFYNGFMKFEPAKVDLEEIFSNEANSYDVDFSDVGI
jgi:hypothetical protein